MELFRTKFLVAHILKNRNAAKVLRNSPIRGNGSSVRTERNLELITTSLDIRYVWGSEFHRPPKYMIFREINRSAVSCRSTTTELTTKRCKWTDTTNTIQPPASSDSDQRSPPRKKTMRPHTTRNKRMTRDRSRFAEFYSHRKHAIKSANFHFLSIRSIIHSLFVFTIL